ncbi:hypothetical protein [Longimicrobium terrae]|uniref:Uncharacterized protein n=1 Tax=Longimicrobium terrae TaxID=1639882 RepID=A0A841H2A5_9BACT|nr:hypothetical protein [Longimicrobium terrae]MBB4637974.1 hypothetical protein [Longimicrobium terrae]MBB6072221.1 hypothetical protein [Longimicrobium terrae]NNC28353.1 hypothetical protein [Longimicrobium terrae]
MADNDDLLPHVLMGDVSRFVLELYKESLDGVNNGGETLDALFAVMERGAAFGSEYVKEVISVSFFGIHCRRTHCLEGVHVLLETGVEQGVSAHTGMDPS